MKLAARRNQSPVVSPKPPQLCHTFVFGRNWPKSERWGGWCDVVWLPVCDRKRSAAAVAPLLRTRWFLEGEELLLRVDTLCLNEPVMSTSFWSNCGGGGS